jgi:hypothetical protein
MSSLNRSAGAVVAWGGLVAVACSPSIDFGTPSPSYDLSAQAYDDAAHVYARRDLVGADAGEPPQFTADLGGASVVMHSTATSASLAADFPANSGPLTAHIREGEDAIATIEVPGVFSVAGVPATLHRGETLRVATSPLPSAGTKVTLRAIPSPCIYVWLDDPLLAKTLSSENGTGVFDLEPIFSSMLERECDLSLGVRYESTGSLTSGRIGQAAGLREVRITIHLVNPSAPLWDAGDYGDGGDASGG